MRVLVCEHWHEGHHYPSLQHLLPRLADLAGEVIVAITPGGHASSEFKEYLAPFGGRVQYLPVLSYASPRFFFNER
jgi:hypothetical protein